MGWEKKAPFAHPLTSPPPPPTQPRGWGCYATLFFVLELGVQCVPRIGNELFRARVVLLFAEGAAQTLSWGLGVVFYLIFVSTPNLDQFRPLQHPRDEVYDTCL